MSRSVPIPIASLLLVVAISACALDASGSIADDAIDQADGDVAVSREAIIAGWDDDGDPDVVALMNGGALTCTGTLIARDLVLTAAHCVDGLPLDSVVAGSDPGAPTHRSSIVTITPHPIFDRATGQHDIAVIRISPGIDAPLRPVLFAPLYPADIGAPVRFVGFGLSGDDRPLRKRLGISAISAIAEQTFDIQGDSQPCRGDSGGPTLLRIDGEEVLAGVHSSGPGDCAGYATETRIDANADFVATFLSPTEYALGAPSASLSGQCSAAPGARGSSSSTWLFVVVGVWSTLILSRALRRSARAARRSSRALVSSVAIAIVVVVPSLAGCAGFEDASSPSPSESRAITMREVPTPGATDPDSVPRDGGAPPPTAPPPPATPPASPPATPPPAAAAGCSPGTITCLESCSDQTCADGCFSSDVACAECFGAAFQTCVTRNGCGPALEALDTCVYESGCFDEACVSSWCASELAVAQSCLPAGACSADEEACLPY